MEQFRLSASTSGGIGSISSWGTKIPHAVWHGNKKHTTTHTQKPTAKQNTQPKQKELNEMGGKCLVRYLLSTSASALLVSNAFIIRADSTKWRNNGKVSPPLQFSYNADCFRLSSSFYKQQWASTHLQAKPALLFWGKNISGGVPSVTAMSDLPSGRRL